MKDVNEMEEEELKRFLKHRGFEDDEIAVSFRTEFDLREAVRDIRKLNDASDEESKGEWDSEDTAELTLDQRTALKSSRKLRQDRLKRLKELQSKKAVIETKELKQSIKETKSGVTPKEASDEMARVTKLLSEGEED